MEPSTPAVLKKTPADTQAAGPAWQRRLYVCPYDTADAPVPPSFSMARLTAFVAGRRGRPVHVATARGWPQWALTWVTDPDADWIIFRQAMPWRQRMQAAAHLAGHLLLGHAGREMNAVMLTDLLFPGLDQALGGKAIVTCGLATDAEDYQANAVMADVIGTATRANYGPVNNQVIA
jgi:hypothetical protein